MKKPQKFTKSVISVLLSLTVVLSMTFMTVSQASADSGTSISYAFSGEDKDTPGYAEGTVTFTAETNGTYYLYWSDNQKALDGYYQITTAAITDSAKSVDFTFGYHTAIPADATKIIAVTSTDAASGATTVSNAVAVYDIPEGKQLGFTSAQANYTFNSYSDIHIDLNANGGGYKYADANFASALSYAANQKVDFIVTSGDNITNDTKNANAYEKDWDKFQTILSQSDYVNPIYEAGGNHELWQGAENGIDAFSIATGLDNTEQSILESKGYYSVTEPKTGDVFIFMALEYNFRAGQADEFSDEQLDWAADLIEENYGKHNIYVIQHALIKGYGAGDFNDKPIYGGGLSWNFLSTVKFKNLMEKYPDIIWMSGHTHEAFSVGNNYSNQNGTSCNMIHNSSVGCPTYPSSSMNGLNYSHSKKNTEGYLVQVFGDEIIFSGANLYDQKIFPAYSYIMEGSRNSDPEATRATEEVTTAPPATGSTLDPSLDTIRYYFVNTQKWSAVDCYAWTGGDSNKWPGYVCTLLTKDENGYDIYYADIPSKYQNIIFNNANQGKQTIDIAVDPNHIINFYTPNGTDSSGRYKVTTSTYTEPSPTEPTTEPIETTAPITTQPGTTEPEPAILLGDTNNDGIVDIWDATVIQKYIAGMTTEINEKAADVDFDGFIRIDDATRIQKKVAEMITDFTNPVVSSAKTAAAVGASQDELSAAITDASAALTANYKFSSYDQYQSLKKLYYTYKGADLTALTAEEIDYCVQAFADRMQSLTSIVEFVNSL